MNSLTFFPVGVNKISFKIILTYYLLIIETIDNHLYLLAIAFVSYSAIV